MGNPSLGRRPSAAFLIEVTLVGLVVFAVAITIAVFTGAEPGTSADWVAAISTFGALIAACFAAWYAAQAFGIERQREDRWQDSQRSAQAALVAAWTRPTLLVRPEEGHMDEYVTGLTVWLRNASQVPVTQVEVEIFVVRRVAPGRKGKLLVTRVYQQSLQVLPPDDAPMELQIADPAAISEADKTWRLVPGYEPEVRVALWFQDSAMVRWRRSTSGILEEQPYDADREPASAKGR